MIVDAHQHFWDAERANYAWMTSEMAAIRRRFEPEDLAPQLAATGVDRTVIVQTLASTEESLRFLAIADTHDTVAGVVGWVDLTAAGVDDAIAELRASPGGSALCAIRHLVHDEPDPDWLLRDDVQRGIAAVGRADLAFDLLVRTRELPAALETVRRHELQFIVDHLAKPQISRGREDPAWACALRPLAALPHVACKLSGLVTEARWARWTPADLQPYIDRAFEWFGVERMMFGSDWPVCLLAASYERVFTTYSRALHRLSAREREDVLGANAVRLYGLSV